MKKKIAFALLMGIITTGTVSFTVILANLGWTDKFFSIWIRSWGIAYLLAVPLILLIGPLVQNIVDLLFKEKLVARE